MPTYQYACTECDHAFEQFQSFTDDALTVCEQCGGRLRKVFNAVGVVFKGSGFYRTDSRSGSSDRTGPDKTGPDQADGSSTKRSEPATASNGTAAKKSDTSTPAASAS